jgi:hypothetical protein
MLAYAVGITVGVTEGGLNVCRFIGYCPLVELMFVLLSGGAL